MGLFLQNVVFNSNTLFLSQSKKKKGANKADAEFGIKKFYNLSKAILDDPEKRAAFTAELIACLDACAGAWQIQ